MSFSNKIFFEQNKCSAWQITPYCWKYDNISIQLSTLHSDFSSGLQEIRFNSAGTKIYATPTFKYRIHEFTLPTAWVLTGLTHVGYLDAQSQVGTSHYVIGFDFSSDGTKLFFCTRESSGASVQYSRIWKYALSTAWKVSGGTYHSVSHTLYGNFLDSIQVINSGAKLIGRCPNDSDIKEYSMSPAYEVSGSSNLSYNNVRITGGTEIGSKIYAKSDGLRLYTGWVRQYNLSTAYSLSGYVDVGTYNPSQGSGGGLHFKSDGRRFYSGEDSNSYVYQFSKK